METNNQIKSAFLWLLIAVGLVMHSLFALDGIFFGATLQLPGTDGSEPMIFKICHIAFEVLPLFFALLTLFVSCRPFMWVSCIYASIFCLCNVAHLIATFGEKPFSIVQIVLLGFVLATNIMLVIILWKSLKSKNVIV